MTRKSLAVAFIAAALVVCAMPALAAKPASAAPATLTVVSRGSLIHDFGVWYRDKDCGSDRGRTVCTSLSAKVTYGHRVSATVKAMNYRVQTYVWLQINITDRQTGELLWRDMVRRLVTNRNPQPSYSVTVDCSPLVDVQAWTWQAGSNVQPGSGLRLPEGRRL